MGKKLSDKHWKGEFEERNSKFGAVVFRHGSQRWAGFVRYFYSETPSLPKSFREHLVCIGTKYRSMRQAMRAVERLARQWTLELMLNFDSDRKTVVMYPKKALWPMIQKFGKQAVKAGVTPEALQEWQDKQMPRQEYAVTSDGNSFTPATTLSLLGDN